MQKLISTILSILIVTTSVSVGFTVPAQEVDEIQGFIDEATEIISEYDSDKEYNVSSKSLDFQTCRLIVEQSQDFNPLNSVAVADGFENFHIIQFENEEDTKSAYEYYSSSCDVISVDIDGVSDFCEYNTDNSNYDTYDVNNMINPASDQMNISKAKQYILDNCPNYTDEIVVGIVDSGVMKNHPAIKGRFKGGKSFVSKQQIDSDGGNDRIGHGTHVAGVIVDSTLPNTKIMSYQVSYQKTSLISSSAVISGILQAVEDKVDVINLSMSVSKSNALFSALRKAKEENIKLIAAAGNSGKEYSYDDVLVYTAALGSTISVGALGVSTRAGYSNYGKGVDVYAYGNVLSTSYDGDYEQVKGTSFSAPYVTGLCAMLTLLYPDETVNQTKLRLLYGATKTADDLYLVDFMGSLLIPNIEETYSTTPEIKVENVANSKKKLVTLSCDDENATIYYYTDTYYCNAMSNEALSYFDDDIFTVKEYYGKPFTVSENCNLYVTTISDGKLESKVASKSIRIGNSANGFYCDDNGVITAFVPDEYVGDIQNIVIPDKLGEVTPTAILDKICDTPFFLEDTISVTMPESIETIGSCCFEFCENLEKVIAPGVKYINDRAFLYAESLEELKLGEVEYIGEMCFNDCSSCDFTDIFKTVIELGLSAFQGCEITRVYAPKLEKAGPSAFADVGLTEINLPSLVEAGYDSFSFNENLEYVNLPIIKNLPKRLFYECPNLKTVYLPQVTSYENNEKLTRLEFDNLENLTLNYKYQPEIISVPNSCASISGIYKKITTVYGTEAEDNYIYNWCVQNSMPFKNISQETALMTDLPMEITDADTELEADVIGFNRTYQWYSNDVADNISGTAIDGATSKYFTPSDYPIADYYYCVVTSTDGDYEPVTICTSVTANKSNTSQVDYSAYNAAMATAQAVIDNPNYSDKYDADTRSEFENRLSELTLDMSIAHSQAEIDNAANSILVLINTLRVTDYVIEFKLFINNSECYSDTINKPYADNIRLDLSDINGMDYSSFSVERWTINLGSITSSTVIARGNKALERVVTDDITISAYLVTKPTDEKEYSKITLLSQSGANIDIGYVEKGSTIDTSTATVLCGRDEIGTAGIIPFYSFGCWRLNGKAVSTIKADNDIILKAEYIYTADTCKLISGSDSVLINSQYNPSGYNAAYDEKIYVKSTDGKKLAMYNENGDFISYIKNTGYISAPKASAIIIREVDEVKPSTTITGAFLTELDGDKDKISFNCLFFLPDGCKLIECGAVMTGNKATADNAQAFVIGAQKTLKAISQSQSENNEYTISLVADYTGKDAFYGRSYLIYADENGNRKIIYGSPYKFNLNKGA